MRGYAPAGTLTPRMRDVLRAAARGCTVQQTAGELGVSAHTVRNVRAAACARLDVHTIAAAVWTAGRHGEL